MKKVKRVIIATLSGVLFGFVCYFLASSGDYEMPWQISAQIITSRTLMGFAIGISCLKLCHWSIHGLVMGLAFSIPLAFSGMLGAETAGFTEIEMFASTVGIGAIYGLLIEVITSVLFKAKMKV